MLAASLAILGLCALLSGMSHATPVTSSSSALIPTTANLAVSHHGLTTDATTIPQLLLCSTANCASCEAILLQNLGDGNCFFAGSFISVGILNPNNVFHVSTDIAPANCQNWVEIPEDNVCFNINGGPFTQYGQLDI